MIFDLENFGFVLTEAFGQSFMLNFRDVIPDNSCEFVDPKRPKASFLSKKIPRLRAREECLGT